jgi:hypothetical protein
MDNHRSEAAKIREFYLAHNTLLGLNKLKYCLPIINVLYMLVTALERLVALNQPRQCNVLLAVQQCNALVVHSVHKISPKFHT